MLATVLLSGLVLTGCGSKDSEALLSEGSWDTLPMGMTADDVFFTPVLTFEDGVVSSEVGAYNPALEEAMSHAEDGGVAIEVGESTSTAPYVIENDVITMPPLGSEEGAETESYAIEWIEEGEEVQFILEGGDPEVDGMVLKKTVE